jgi:ankyrin repeat protein
MPIRSLPARPHLDQLKRQAKELLQREPTLGRLRDAQRALAAQYGFASWDALRANVESRTRPASHGLIKPESLNSAEGQAVWDVIAASSEGNADELRRLLQSNRKLSRAQYWYTQPLHFAVRDGHLEAVKLLIQAGADPEWNGMYDGSLIEMALDRGYTEIARLLEDARQRAGRVAPDEDLPIHQAAQSDDVKRVRRMLDADPSLLERGDRIGGSPLHRAVIGSARQVIGLLLDRGANIHAFHSTSRGGGGGWCATGVQAIDLAIWGWNLLAWAKGDVKTARLLVARGAEHDLTVASALGDTDRVKAILAENPSAIRDLRANGRRPLSAAVEFRHDAIVTLLLDAGADPRWPEYGSPKGASLRIAVSKPHNRALVELLLARGADPNSDIDSGGTAVWGAPPELRPLLIAHGGTIDSYESVWMDEDDEVLRRAAENPAAFDGSVFTAVVTRGKRELLQRLLEIGVRVPPVLTGCQSYLLEHTDMLRTLLAHGMTPDLMNWQRQTLLHLVCGARDTTRASIEKAAILLDAGADISARDEEYRSTPLAWAARTNALEVAAFLLSRGAPVNLPDDEPWATPLAWAERRGHAAMAAILSRHGASQ